MAKKKNVGGRPSAITPDVVNKLRHAFMYDGTIEDACKYAGISKVTFYKYYKENEEFMNEIDRVRTYATRTARRVLINWLDSKNEAIAQKAAIEILRRRDPRYRDKLEGTIDGDVEVKGEVKLDGKTMIELEDMRKKFLWFK